VRWSWVLVLAGCGRLGFDPGAPRDGDLVFGDGVRPDITPIDVVPLDSSLPAGLIAWYPMDDTATNTADVVGGVNGTCAVGECPTSIPGHHGNAFLFDAGDDCFSIPDLGQLSIPTYTISIWTRQDASDNCSAIAKRVDISGNVLNSWQLETNTNGQLAATMNSGQTSNSKLSSATGIVTLGQWRHAALVVGNGTRTLYYNGTSVGSSAWTTTSYDVNTIWVGCDDNGANMSLHWNGGLDDLQIYNRALTQAEIQTIASQ
jgi:hypothetical protein